MTDNTFRTVQIRKELHEKIKRLAVFNDVKLKILASEVLACMLMEHQKEVEQIIRKLRITK